MGRNYLIISIGKDEYEREYRIPKPVTVLVGEGGDSLDRRLRAHWSVRLRRGPIRIFEMSSGGYFLDNAARNEEGVDGVFKSTRFGALRQMLHWWGKEWQLRIVEMERNHLPVPPRHVRTVANVTEELCVATL